MYERQQWHAMDPKGVLGLLKTGSRGLEADEAARRLQADGLNILKLEKPMSPVQLLWRQLKNPLLLILIIGGIVSFSLGEHLDAGAIAIVLLLNVALGFVQEFQADRALFALKHYLPVQALVRRNGQPVEIPATEIVAGDILLLAPGMRIAADARLISAKDFAALEAPLTGESAEVEKGIAVVAVDAPVAERTSLVFAGTTVARGTAEAVVVATGVHTVFGTLAELTQSAQDRQTPLSADIARLSRKLTVFMVILALGFFCFGFLKGLAPATIATMSVALAIAVVPEGLPVSLTVTLAVGMRRMLKKGALVRRLLAAETLGSVTVMCVDKTGTLTTGEMTLTHVDASDKTKMLFCLEVLSRNAQAHDALASSLVERAVAAYVKKQNTNHDATLLDEIPFSSAKKYSGKVVSTKGKAETVLMGAPEVLFLMLDISDSEQQMWRSRHRAMTTQGLRVMLVAVRTGAVDRDALHDFVPVGFVGFSDPLREEAPAAIAQAEQAGMRFIMLTGDHADTAAHIAARLGLLPKGELVSSVDLAALSDGELARRLQRVSVVARMSPEDKLRIVKCLQASGEVVAMSGDGVNDAPALKAADIGVSLQSGTDVAKEAADIVLLENNISVLVAAIAEGRLVFENIRKVTAYLLAFSASEALLIGAALLLDLPLPLTALQILWINIVTDGLPAIGLAFEPLEPHVLRLPPRRAHTPLLGGRILHFVLTAIVVVLLPLLALAHTAYASGMSIDALRSLLFIALASDALLGVYVFRRFHTIGVQASSFTNPRLWIAVVMSGLLVCAAFFVLPLPPFVWINAVFLLSILKVLLIEAMKWFILVRHRASLAPLVS